MSEATWYWLLGMSLLAIASLSFVYKALLINKRSISTSPSESDSKDSVTAKNIGNPKASILLVLGFCIVMIAMALGIYHFKGASSALSDTLLIQHMQTKIEATLRTPGFKAQDLQNTLKEIESELGSSAYAWARLSELYSQMGLIPEAKAALLNATKFDPKNLNYQAEYLNLLFMEEGDTLSEEAQKQLKHILSQDPKHPGALNLRAIYYFHHQEYSKAIEDWTILLNDAPKDSEIVNTLKAAIARAKMLKQQSAGEKS